MDIFSEHFHQGNDQRFVWSRNLAQYPHIILHLTTKLRSKRKERDKNPYMYHTAEILLVYSLRITHYRPVICNKALLFTYCNIFSPEYQSLWFDFHLLSQFLLSLVAWWLTISHIWHLCCKFWNVPCISGHHISGSLSVTCWSSVVLHVFKEKNLNKQDEIFRYFCTGLKRGLNTDK